MAVSDEMRARIKSFLESQWTTFKKLCSSAEIAKAGMEVAQLAAKHRLAIPEFAEGIPETRKPEDPEFVLRAMGALALFDNFKWIIIREGRKLNLVSADASDGGKPGASVDPDEQEISKPMEALKVRLEHKRTAKIVRPLTLAALDEFVEAPGNAKWMRETTPPSPPLPGEVSSRSPITSGCRHILHKAPGGPLPRHRRCRLSQCSSR